MLTRMALIENRASPTNKWPIDRRFIPPLSDKPKLDWYGLVISCYIMLYIYIMLYHMISAYTSTEYHLMTTTCRKLKSQILSDYQHVSTQVFSINLPNGLFVDHFPSSKPPFAGGFPKCPHPTEPPGSFHFVPLRSTGSR